MAASPAFKSTPRIGVGRFSAANTARDGTGTITDVIAGVTAGTKIEEVVIKAEDQFAACVVILWLYDGSAWRMFDEVAVTSPPDGSNTVAGYRISNTYSNLVLPSSSWKLGATITVQPTAGNCVVVALGGDLT